MKFGTNKRRKGAVRGTVLIALPAYSTVTFENWEFIERNRADLAARQLNIALIRGRGTYVHVARDNCIKQAYKCPYPWSHLMFVDADMSGPPDLIWNLMQRDKDIVAGAYVQKCFPWWPNCGVQNADGVTYNMNKIDYKAGVEAEACVPVDMAGTGLMLIKKKVLDAMQPPWFEFLPIELPPELHEQVTPIHRQTHKSLGEDVSFCKKAREMGFEVWFDLAHRGTHIGSYGYVIEDHLNPNTQAAKEAELSMRGKIRPEVPV